MTNTTIWPICASRSTENGLLMIGTPSLESQAYASPPSKAGHVNCKTGTELKALLEKYFEHVFMFSMNDEVVHTGFSPMAHYLFALCTAPKWEGRRFQAAGRAANRANSRSASPRRLRILCARDPSQHRAAKGRRLCHCRRCGALDRHPGAGLVQIRSSVILFEPASETRALRHGIKSADRHRFRQHHHHLRRCVLRRRRSGRTDRAGFFRKQAGGARRHPAFAGRRTCLAAPARPSLRQGHWRRGHGRRASRRFCAAAGPRAARSPSSATRPNTATSIPIA